MFVLVEHSVLTMNDSVNNQFDQYIRKVVFSSLL